MNKSILVLATAMCMVSITSDARSLNEHYMTIETPVKLTQSSSGSTASDSNTSSTTTSEDEDELVVPPKERATSDKYAEPAAENPYSGLAPLFGRNIASVLLTDIINCFYAPEMASYIALAIDGVLFLIMPTMGGILMTSVNYNFD